VIESYPTYKNLKFQVFFISFIPKVKYVVSFQVEFLLSTSIPSRLLAFLTNGSLIVTKVSSNQLKWD